MTETNELKGVGTLTIGGKDYTYKLDNNALRLMCRSLNITLDAVTKLMASDPIESIPQFIFAGIKNHQARKGEAFKMDFEQFAALFGDVWDDDDQMEQINNVISNAWSLEDATNTDESELKVVEEKAEA